MIERGPTSHDVSCNGKAGHANPRLRLASDLPKGPTLQYTELTIYCCSFSPAQYHNIYPDLDPVAETDVWPSCSHDQCWSCQMTCPACAQSCWQWCWCWHHSSSSPSQSQVPELFPPKLLAGRCTPNMAQTVVRGRSPIALSRHVVEKDGSSWDYCPGYQLQQTPEDPRWWQKFAGYQTDQLRRQELRERWEQWTQQERRSRRELREHEWVVQRQEQQLGSPDYSRKPQWRWMEMMDAYFACFSSEVTRGGTYQRMIINNQYLPYMSIFNLLFGSYILHSGRCRLRG